MSDTATAQAMATPLLLDKALAGRCARLVDKHDEFDVRVFGKQQTCAGNWNKHVILTNPGCL
jgi:hypothetical protein